MINKKESFIKKFLRFIGLIKNVEIPKQTMCEQAQNVCNHNCNSCAWNSREEEK